MAHLDDSDVASIREDVHTINNALNVVSMQAELVRVLAADGPAADRIGSAIEIILADCQKAGRSASDIGRRVKRGD